MFSFVVEKYTYMFNTDALLDIVQLEQLDIGLFRGQNYMTPWKRVFGGQVLGQALNAAYQTVPDDRLAHSIHGYFILSGDVDKPIIYQVENLRDGGSFTTRRVTASQGGKAIFIMSASFQLEQDGFDHQIPMPEVINPENLLADYEIAERLKERSPEVVNIIKYRHQSAIEFRPEDQFQFEEVLPGSMERKVWMKLAEEKDLTIPLQHQLLAYASDYNLLVTAFFPYRTPENSKNFFIASLDHAMWFHRNFDFNDWLLYNVSSPSASNSRGMGHGKIYNRQGELICSVMQEGLIRIKRS